MEIIKRPSIRNFATIEWQGNISEYRKGVSDGWVFQMLGDEGRNCAAIVKGEKELQKA